MGRRKDGTPNYLLSLYGCFSIRRGHENSQTVEDARPFPMGALPGAA
jgi:hypothetical protein